MEDKCANCEYAGLCACSNCDERDICECWGFNNCQNSPQENCIKTYEEDESFLDLD